MEKIEEEKFWFKLETEKAVCFDFDGVIHKYRSGWKDGSIYDEYNKNAIDLIVFLQQSGIPVFICSAREPEQIINWWNKQGFIHKAVKIKYNEKFWNRTDLIGVTNRKLPAQMYIDDRAYKYTGQTVEQFIKDNSIKINQDENIAKNMFQETIEELEQENEQLKQKIKDLQESIRNIINNM